MQEEKKHPIDVKIDAMIEKNGSTAGMVQALDLGYKLWDAELNKQYKALMARLKGIEREALTTSQKAWLTFRDREFVTIGRIYDRMQGTMYIPMRLSAKVNLVKQRAQTLTRYNELLDEA